MVKVLFVLTSCDSKGDSGEPTGFFLSEMTHPHQVFIDNGFNVDFVSPKGGEAPIDGFDLKDPINKAFMDNEEYLNQIKSTKTPDEINAGDYDAIYFAGGHGTMWDLPDNDKLANITTQIYENGGVVGAVCHGPAGLVNVKLSDGSYLVANKQVSSFTNEEEESVNLDKVVPFLLESKLIERGGKHTKAANFEEHVVTDGKLVTGQNPASAKAVGEGMVRVLYRS